MRVGLVAVQGVLRAHILVPRLTQPTWGIGYKAHDCEFCPSKTPTHANRNVGFNFTIRICAFCLGETQKKVQIVKLGISFKRNKIKHF